MDFDESSNVRRYLLSSLQHGRFKPDAPTTASRTTASASNSATPTHPGPLLRALVVALDEWVIRNTAPPDQRVPRIADGTLVHASDLKFPKIPGRDLRRLV